jgi:hypothetical protein
MDTDCTAATCGAFLGILSGMHGIDPSLARIVGSDVAVAGFLSGKGLPATTSELTARTIRLSQKLQSKLLDFKPDLAFEQIQDPVDDGHSWLLFSDESLCNEFGKNTAASGYVFLSSPGIHVPFTDRLKLPLQSPCLLTHLSVPADTDAFIMICSDAGITAWLDDRMILNYHGRRPALPASHRTEGGATVPVQLKKDIKYKLKIRFWNVTHPATLAAALLDNNNRYIDRFSFQALV